MIVIDDLIAELGMACAGLPDQRTGQCRDGQYTMTDIGLSAFSLFFMGSPSFLAHQRALARGHGRSNCQTLFGISAIPSDNYIRLMLDGASPGAFDQLFFRAIDAAGPLTRFHCLDGRVLIALDGSEYFCSRKISCPQCSTRRRADGGTEHFHAFLGATIVAPGHHQVLPLPPEFIAPQDGAEKQDCERNAAKRWLARHGRSVAHLRPIFLGDDLFACQPIATAIQQAGGNFILTCKPSSHQTVTEYLHGAKLEEHRQTIRKGRQHTTIVYRWLSGVPLRASADAITVNWFSIEIRNAAGKRTYYNSFVTDLAVTADNVAELAASGRARWKIENETFNVLKTNGYNLEHNFGHGKATLASVFLTLNLLAFAFHTAGWLAALAWRAAVAACGATYRFFENLRTITAYIVFQDWPHLLQAIAAADLRPP
ncbi:MAG TPA: ISNCY family transposase [Acetobacteraceae bacterium]|nr:ISNCY family transposase [Acetobacteraceae bacterium]